LRVRDELTEIRAADLRFSAEEVQQFFDNTTQLSLTTHNTTSIEQRTEGWAVGLQLAALALKRTHNIDDFVANFSGSHRYVMDYLTDEVLNQLSEAENWFLLHTSILESMCADLCNAITGREDSQAQLEQLEAINLFLIPLDYERRWYRYHHLFATLLQHRLRQLPQDEQNALHLRAAKWYENNGMIDAAMKHHKSAENIEGIVKIIGNHARESIMVGNIMQVQGWLHNLPEELVRENLLLAGLQAWMHYFMQQSEQTAKWINHANVALQQMLPMPDEHYIHAWGSMIALQAWVAIQRGDWQAAIQITQDAIEKLPESMLAERGMNYAFLAEALAASGNPADANAAYNMSIQYNETGGNWIAVTGMTSSIADMYLAQGHLQQAKVLLDDIIEKVTALGQPKSTSNPRTFRLKIWHELNKLDEMREELAIVWQMVQYDVSKATVPYHLMAAIYYVAQGNHEDAVDELQQVEVEIQDWTMLHDKAIILAQIMRVYIQLGLLEKPLEWLKSTEITINNLDYLRIKIYLAAVDVLRFVEQSGDNALELITQLHQLCATVSAVGFRLDVYCLEALHMARIGDSLGALSPLREALIIAEQAGYIRSFVRYGEPMAHLLYEASARKIHTDYAGFLLAQFPDIEANQQNSQPQQGLIEPLSEREIEILNLLAEGLSNQEIANRVYLTVNTIKVHNRNIFGKLNVKNRTQAVAKGRQLGIVGNMNSFRQ